MPKVGVTWLPLYFPTVLGEQQVHYAEQAAPE